MSRTDKDKPYWVEAEWYEPVHSIYCENVISRSWQKTSRLEPCNLPAEPVVHKQIWSRRSNNCVWVAEWPHRKYGYQDGPQPHDRRQAHRAYRARVRMQLVECVREFNTDGEVETIPEVSQHPEFWFYWW